MKKETNKKKEQRKRRAVTYHQRRHWADDHLTNMTIIASCQDRYNLEVVEDFYDASGEFAYARPIDSRGFKSMLDFCRQERDVGMPIEAVVVVDRGHLGLNVAEYLESKLELDRLGIKVITAVEEYPDCTIEDILKVLHKYHYGSLLSHQGRMVAQGFERITKDASQ